MWKFRWYKLPVYIVLTAALITGIGYVTMVLWNALVPGLFNGPAITFWQTIGLLVLTRLFFHLWHRPYYHRYYGWHPRSRYWKRRLEERMASMSPEDREKFKEEWKRRCGHEYWEGRSKEEEGQGK